MEVFEGTVRLAGDSGTLQAVLLVADNRLKVKTSHAEIGEWPLSDLHSRIRPDGCHIVAEGEELVVSVDEPMRFAEAIGPSIANPGDGSLRGPEPPGLFRNGFEQALNRMQAVPPARKVAGAALLATAVLFLVAPTALLALTLLAGLAGLLVGGYALMDPFTAVRLPEPVNPQLLIRTGGLALLLSIVLAMII